LIAFDLMPGLTLGKSPTSEDADLLDDDLSYVVAWASFVRCPAEIRTRVR